MLRKLLVGVVLVVTFGTLARGQALVDAVPPDAMVYIGWAGADSMPPGYEQSHLKAILDASQFRQLFTETLPRLAKVMEREDPDAAQAFAGFSAVAEPLWRYPSAIYFGGVNTTNPRRPLPRLAALIHAKDQAPALVQSLQQRIAKLGPTPVPITVADAGGVVALVVGELPAIEADKAPASLVGNERFAAAMAQVRKEGVLHVYVDGEALVAMVDQLTTAYASPREQADWAKARDALDLRGIHRIAYSGSFDGRDWRDDLYIQAPAPRTGIAVLLDAKPVEEAALAVIPQDASIAMAGRLDLSRVMQEVRTALGKIDANLVAKMEQGLADINGRLEMDLEKDLLEPLGDQWAFYAADSIGGDGLMGFCIINKADDAAKLDQALWQLSQQANEAMQHVGGGKLTLQFKQFEQDGLQVRYFAIPMVSPSWAVKDGNLYIGLYPQVVVAAANHVTARGKSLIDNPKYQAIRRRLGVTEAGWVEFYDLEKRVPAGYTSMLVFLRLYLGMADLVGAQSPAMIVPPLNVLMRHVSPAGAVTWADEQGFYVRSIQPFPGSTNLATADISSALVGHQAMMISILLPSLNRARETANRVKCASNMRQIGQATLLYANENRQRLPDDLGTLLRTQDLGLEVFVCPSSYNDIPHEIRTAPVDRQAEWVNANASFVWLVPPGSGLRFNLEADVVMLHERIDNHDGDGMNLLYADGHVEFQHMAMALQEAEKSKQTLEKLARERKQR